jgi:hypothetical protein
MYIYKCLTLKSDAETNKGSLTVLMSEEFK